MNKTKIEYVDYTINPIRGLCKNDCPYCYAKRMYRRFGWDENISCNYGVFNEVEKLKKPSRIFIGSMHDIFGEWIYYNWISNIIQYCSDFPQHTFIFLTKNPKRYAEFIFPDNCWLGVTIDGKENPKNLEEKMQDFLFNAKNIKFISYEPLLNMDAYYVRFIKFVDWVIVGGLTPKPVHLKSWVYGILQIAKHHNKPVFLKDNLKYPEIIKEFPEA